jgi:TRAP-type C4-dicarboxylate transport system permease small subunit
MKAMLRFIHGLENALLYLLITLLLGISIYQIVARNLFDSGLYWGDPLLRVLVLWLALVGAMLASREGSHIRIDVISHYLAERAQGVANSITAVFSSVVCFIAAYYGFLFVADEREYGMSAFANVPAWWCEAIIPIGLSVVGMRFALEFFAALFQREARA